jgi:hypothetical protein
VIVVKVILISNVDSFDFHLDSVKEIKGYAKEGGWWL